MKAYDIEVSWTQTTILQIEAENEEEARIKADACILPVGDYLNDSFTIDEVNEVNHANNR